MRIMNEWNVHQNMMVKFEFSKWFDGRMNLIYDFEFESDFFISKLIGNSPFVYALLGCLLGGGGGACALDKLTSLENK